MQLKINSTAVPVNPKDFKVEVMDLDDSESTTRSANGTLTRDRIAVKRKIDIAWGPLEWAPMSQILNLMSGVFFELYYPDPMVGTYTTKTFYVGNRPAPYLRERNGETMWQGLQVNLIEK